MTGGALDFDPFRIPDQVSAWVRDQPEAERDRAAGAFAKRAVAAMHVLKAVNELRAAREQVDDARLPGPIRELLKVARDLHDYDPTSD